MSKRVIFTQITAVTVLTRDVETHTSMGVPTSYIENEIVVIVALDSEGQIWEKVGLEDWGKVTSPQKPKGRL